MRYLSKVLGYVANSLWLLPAVVSLLLVFIVPPYQSPDEQTHFYRAYQLSEGNLLGKRLSYGSGDFLPTSLSSSFGMYRYILFDKDAKTTPQQLLRSLQVPLERSNRTETRFENTVIYPPFSYIPQVVGIGLGRIFSLGPIWLLLMARLSVLAAWILSLRFMMKRHRELYLPLFAFSMLPIVLFQSASAAADMVTVTITTLTVAEIVRGFIRKLTKSDVIFLSILGGALAFSKFPYSIVLVMAILLPNRNFETKKQALLLKLSIAFSILVSLLWVLIANHGFVNLRAFVDTSAQLSFILYHPFSYAIIVFRTLFSTYGDTLLLQSSGILGWLDTKLPLWLTFSSLFSVVLAATTIKISSSKTMRIIFSGTLICAVLAIVSLLYLTWCSPKAPLIDGVQGRYFMPLIGLFIGAVGGIVTVNNKSAITIRRWVIGMGIVSAITTVVVIISRYYVV